MKTAVVILVFALFANGAYSKNLPRNDILTNTLKVRDVGDPLVCEFCEAAFKHFKDVFSTYQSQLKNALLNFCKITGSYSTECSALVNQYYDKLFDLIVNKFNSTEFCTLITLCPGSTVRLSSSLNVVNASNSIRSEMCSICNEAIAVVDLELKEESVRTYIKSELKSVCSAVGSYKDVCEGLYDAYFDKAYDEVVTLLEKNDLCEELDICPSTGKSSKMSLSDEACTICEETIGTMKMLLQNSGLKTTVKTEVLSLCAELGSLQEECKVGVNLVFDKAYDYLLNLLNPYVLCRDLKLCKQSSLQQLKPAMKVTKPEKSNFCLLCVEGLDVVKTLLNSTKFRALLKDKVEELCSEVPSYSSECKTYVSQYFDVLYDELIKELNDDDVCTLLGACAGRKERFGSEFCTICKTGFTALKEDLEDAGTQKIVKEAVLNLCTKMGSVSSTCSTYVSDYFDLAYQLAIGYLNPQSICSDMHLCPAKVSSSESSESKSSSSESSESKEDAKSGEFCEICKLGIQELKKEVSSPTFEGQLKAEVLKVCTSLGSLSTECNSLVSQYFPVLYNVILGYLDPETVCAEAGLCSKTEKTILIEKKMSSEYCTICESGFQYLKTKLSDPKVQGMISSEVLKACSELGSYSSICQTYVKKYFTPAFEIALQYLNPDEVCSELHLCQSIAGSKLSKVSNGTTCSVCKTITTLFASEIKELEEKGKVLAYSEILKLCTKLPGDIAAQCNDFIKIYGPPVLQMTVEEYGNPDEICTELKIC